MVHVPILLVSVMWIGVQALPVQSEQAAASESFSQTVDLAQLARDTVRFCYYPNDHPHEVCKTYVFASAFSDNWQTSREYCISLGELSGVPLDLVAIESREENEIIKNHIETNYPTMNWWTSGNDLSTAQMYIWGSTGYGFTYYDWQKNQPNPGQYAVLLFHANGVLKWSDAYLTSSYYALCEQNN